MKDNLKQAAQPHAKHKRKSWEAIHAKLIRGRYNDKKRRLLARLNPI